MEKQTYDSVFDIANDEELEFEAMFDEEDDLADTIEGVDEDGNSLIYSEADDFAELHQTDDDATPSDIEDELGPGHDESFGAKGVEGTSKLDLDDEQEIDNLLDNGESDADKELGLEKLDDEYQDGKADGKAPDADNVTDVVEDELGESFEDIDSELDPVSEAEEDSGDVDDELDPVSTPNDTADGEEHPVSDEIPSDTGEGEPTSECGACSPEVAEMIRKAEEAGYTVKAPGCNIEDIVAKLRELGFEVVEGEAEEDEALVGAPEGPADEKCGESFDDFDLDLNSFTEADDEDFDAEMESDDEAEGTESEEDFEDVDDSLEEAGEIDDDFDMDDVAPEGDEDYNDDDTASVGEAVDDDFDMDDVAPEGDEDYNDDDTASVGEAADEVDDEVEDLIADEVESGGKSSLNLEYDPSDEDLIDIVMNN